jgi:hypothetical protein
MKHGIYFWRLQQAEKWKRPTAQQKTALGTSILTLWWLPFVAFIFVAPFIWAFLSLRYRWVSLAGIGVFVLMALPAFTQYGGTQGSIAAVFIGFMLLVWLFWFHRPTIRPLMLHGERVSIPLGENKRLALSYMHFTLWSWFNRKAPRNATKRLTKRLMKVAYARRYWGEQNPADFMKVSVNAPGIYQVDFTIPVGYINSQFMRNAVVEFEAALHFVQVVPLEIEQRKGFVSVLFCEVNPLDMDLDSADAPVLNMTKEELDNPYCWLGVGIDSLARPFELPMFLSDVGSVRMLTAGASGAGKSSIVRQRLLFAVMNPYIDVLVMDGKGSEFGLFKNHVQSYETTLEGFWKQLDFLEAEMTRRAEILSYNKEHQEERFSSTWNPQDDGNLLYWLWDELGAVMGRMSPAENKEAFKRIYGVTSIARSHGLAVEFSSQTFKADLLETRTRDNCFDLKLSFKQETLQEAVYIGFDSEDSIRPDLIQGKILRSGRWSSVGQFATKGVGSATMGKSYYITDTQIKSALATIQPITDNGSSPEGLTLVKEVEGYLEDFGE